MGVHYDTPPRDLCSVFISHPSGKPDFLVSRFFHTKKKPQTRIPAKFTTLRAPPGARTLDTLIKSYLVPPASGMDADMAGSAVAVGWTVW